MPPSRQKYPSQMHPPPFGEEPRFWCGFEKMLKIFFRPGNHMAVVSVHKGTHITMLSKGWIGQFMDLGQIEATMTKKRVFRPKSLSPFLANMAPNSQNGPIHPKCCSNRSTYGYHSMEIPSWNHFSGIAPKQHISIFCRKVEDFYLCATTPLVDI